MDTKISKIARQIAEKLDAADNGGKNGKIGKEQWNLFVAAGKGKTIKNYIKIDVAIRSIGYYLSRESQKENENVNDLGAKWLDGIGQTEIKMLQGVPENADLVKGLENETFTAKEVKIFEDKKEETPKQELSQKAQPDMAEAQKEVDAVVSNPAPSDKESAVVENPVDVSRIVDSGNSIYQLPIMVR